LLLGEPGVKCLVNRVDDFVQERVPLPVFVLMTSDGDDLLDVVAPSQVFPTDKVRLFGDGEQPAYHSDLSR
jgi:hypothetical protein